MKKLLLLGLLSLSTLSLTAQQTNETIEIGGVNREYIQYLPVNFDQTTENLPTVIVYHGLGGTNAQIAAAGFNLIADTARIIVFYPQGKANAFGQSAWNNGTAASSSADDIAFTNFLMDKAIGNYNADNARQYVTGFSMGSIMSYHLACNLNDRVAAIGAMAGPMSTSDINSCNPSYLTPIIHFHGTADQTVPYDSDPLPSLSLVTETLDFWKNKKSCGTTSDSTQIANSANDGLTTDRFVYNGCDEDKSLEHWRTNGGGHDYYAQPANDFTHSIEVWNFLRKWSHPSPITQTASLYENKLDVLNIYPNPATTTINLDLNFKVSSLSVYDQTGKLVKNIANTTKEVSVSDLETGLYILKAVGINTVITKQFLVK